MLQNRAVAMDALSLKSVIAVSMGQHARESLLRPSCLQPHAEHGFRASILSFGGTIEQVILLSLSAPLTASPCMSREYSPTTGELQCARLKTLINHWRSEQHLICIVFCRHKKRKTHILLLPCYVKYQHT